MAGTDGDGSIRVWPFDEAPEDLRALSPHGGDEDWLALLPARYRGDLPRWIEYGSFGSYETTTHDLPDGRIVAIGTHG